MPKGVLPPEVTLDDLKVRIRKSYTNPSVGKINQVVLKEGPRTFRLATLLEITDKKTSAFHHYSLKIDSIDRLKKGWFHKPEKSIRLDGGDPNEIDKLYKFLAAAMEGGLTNQEGDLHIIDSKDYEKLENLVGVLPKLATSDKIELIKTILPHIEAEGTHVNDFVDAFQNTSPETVRHLGIASKIVDFRKALKALTELIENSATPERALQKHLEKNPWMFGSEYSELLDRRHWTRDENLDFMLRRTVDNFLEIVEIKTPFKEPLLYHDDSHNSYYPSSKLSTVLGQVINYIEQVERDRDSIISKDGHDTLKIRARIIIGREGSEKVQKALHNFNSHLHRIEILTFDQLLRISARVLSVFETEYIEHESSSDEVPF